jgi:hypothetical protein
MHSNRWEVAFAEKLVELSASCSALDENDDLIEFKLVKQFVETTILLGFGETDVVLL